MRLSTCLLASALLFEAGSAQARDLVHVYVVPDDDVGANLCDAECLEGVVRKIRGRRGVTKASVVGNAVRVEVVHGGFRSGELIKGLEGMKMEMRVPYKAVELHFLPEGPFPPVSRLDEDVLVVEAGEDVKKAIELATHVTLPSKMKCFGRLTGSDVNEAVLSRYEEEKVPPAAMVSFMAEADLDGDGQQDLYLRLEGPGEVVVFGGDDELRALAVGGGDRKELPRCEVTPTRFARPVAKQRVKCMSPTPHDGDAVERVQHNKSSQLLLFDSGKFASCESLGDGAIPQGSKPVGRKLDKEKEKEKGKVRDRESEDPW
ncbi:MAG: hypothetical protein HY901_24250 [Deltaproteobacteria bacterium]|nr:hypothetical protein [Deltaproteobacteria bacterium]